MKTISSKIKLLTPYCKVFLSFSLFTFHFSFLVAQSHKIDSLQEKVANDKEDTGKVNDMIKLARIYNNTGVYPAKITAFFTDMVKLAERLNYKKGLGRAYYEYGSYYSKQGNTSAAVDNYMKAADNSHQAGDMQREAYAYTSIGVNQDMNGNSVEALKYIMKALDICTKTGDKRGAAKNVCCLGNIAGTQNDVVAALNYYYRAVAMYDSAGDTFGAAQVMGNIGNIYNQEKEYDKALAIYNKVLKVDEAQHSEDNMTRELIHIGEIYMAQGEYAKAHDNFKEAIERAHHLGIMRIYVTALSRMGILGVEDKQYGEAERYLHEALKLADSSGYADVKTDVLKAISGMYVQQGNWRNAYEYYMLFTNAYDSIVNANKGRQVSRLEAKYDYDKQIALQQAKEEERAAISKAESERQSTVIAFIAIVAAAAAGVAIAIFRSLKVTRKQKEEIEKQKKAVEEQKSIVEAKNEEILDSITYAKRLQDAILPPLSVIEKYLPDSFVLYKPKDIVAGDFYWFHIPSQPSPWGEGVSQSPFRGLGQEHPSGEVVFIAACDCTGHGVPGAMVSVVCSNALNRAVKEFGLTEPGKILDKTRELVIETFSQRDPVESTSEGNIQDGMDISLASLTPSEGGIELQWSGAYNPLWYITEGKLVEIAGDKQPIGKTDKPRPFATQSLDLNKGDVLYLFTDGYADQFGGEKGKKFKYKQLQQLLMDNVQLPMAEQKKVLEKAFTEWQGSLEQTDDVCVIGIRI
jgi:tetratricopeptide (TPR) repeat protein